MRAVAPPWVFLLAFSTLAGCAHTPKDSLKRPKISGVTWSEFKHEPGLFSIDTPAGWSSRTDEFFGDYRSPATFSPPGNSKARFKVMYNRFDGSTLDDFVERYGNSMLASGVAREKPVVKKLKIDGYDARSVTYPIAGGGELTYYYFLVQGWRFALVAGVPQEEPALGPVMRHMAASLDVDPKSLLDITPAGIDAVVKMANRKPDTPTQMDPVDIQSITWLKFDYPTGLFSLEVPSEWSHYKPEGPYSAHDWAGFKFKGGFNYQLVIENRPARFPSVDKVVEDRRKVHVQYGGDAVFDLTPVEKLNISGQEARTYSYMPKAERPTSSTLTVYIFLVGEREFWIKTEFPYRMKERIRPILRRIADSFKVNPEKLEIPKD